MHWLLPHSVHTLSPRDNEREAQAYLDPGFWKGQLSGQSFSGGDARVGVLLEQGLQSPFLRRLQNKPPPSGSWWEWACGRENSQWIRKAFRRMPTGGGCGLSSSLWALSTPCGAGWLSLCRARIHLRACSTGHRQPAISPCPPPRNRGKRVQDLGNYQPLPSPGMACQGIEETLGGSEGGKGGEQLDRGRRNSEDPSAPQIHRGNSRADNTS